MTFISVDKLSRVRKRFGIRKRLSVLKSKAPFKSFFSRSNLTVAIVRYGGKPSEVTTKAIRLVIEELEILSVSQLGYSKRRFNSHPSIYMGGVANLSYICMNVKNDSALMNNEITVKIGDLCLDRSWKNWHKNMFFFNLLKVIKKEIVVYSKWKDNLYRVSRLIGQSLTSNNLEQAFLLNMIAIEALLTEQGDKYTEVLPKRIEAFIGWVGYWNRRNYKEEIKSVYKKRCEYIHDGNDKHIEIKDLLFTDDLLFNILSNLVSHTKIFKSKKDIIVFTTKVSAENVLGVVGNKSKIRPKTLHFFSRRYTDDDYKKI
ncbi:MAG: hypothetical protein JXD22_03505 [Sedimentisphaerales bacterium]|nr:hypothetical protein [Sedimentisphaerales bacterium]